MWVCSREGFPLTVLGCSTAAGSSRYSSESIFIIDIQLLRDFGETEPSLGHGTWGMWLRFCNENMKASFSLFKRLLCCKCRAWCLSADLFVGISMHFISLASGCCLFRETASCKRAREFVINRGNFIKHCLCWTRTLNIARR